MRILFLFAILLQSLTFQGQGIVFETGSWNDVLSKATKENKPIFVDCYTTWCGPCKWLSANVFVNPSVGGFYNANFVNYKLDMEKGEGKDFRTKYQIAAYPTLMYINGKGEVVHRAVGAMDTTAFIRLGETALDTSRNFGSFLLKYNAGNREPSFLAAFAQNAYNANYPFNIDEYFKTQSDEQLTSEQNFALIEMYNPPVTSREFSVMLKNRPAFYTTVGTYRTDNRIRYILLRQVYMNEKTIDLTNLQKFLLPVIIPFNISDSSELALKTEMDYHQNRSRNWARYLEIMNQLESKHGKNAFTPTEWISICENLILYNNTLPDLTATIKKYVEYTDNAGALLYKQSLIHGWLLKQEQKPNDEWILKAKEAATKEKLSDQQFERLRKSYFPE